MATIQLHVQDDLIQQLGVDAVQQLLQEELIYQRLKLIESRIQSTMHDARDVNWEEEFENARQQAYEEYRQKRQAAL